MPGFEKIAGLISALAQIQNQRRELDLKEEQFKEGKAQFAQTMGFNKQSEHTKNFNKALDLFINSSAEARSALPEIGKSLGLNDQELLALKSFGMLSPEGIEALKATAATQGYRNPNATPLQRETTAAALTGQNQGQLGVSGLTQQLASGPVSADQKAGFVQRAATGQNPLEAMINQRIQGTPAMVNRMADIASGGISPLQAGQLDIGRGQVQAQFANVRQNQIAADQNIALQLATKKGAGGALTPEEIVAFQRQMTDLLQVMSDPNSAQAIRTQAMAQYNDLAMRSGMTDLLWTEANKPTAAGIVERLWRNVRPAQPSIPTGGIPMGSPTLQPAMPGGAIPLGGALPNPLQQFLPPGARP